MRAQLRSGLSLIELMIVIAIVGLIAAVAIPAYIQYVSDSKRAEASQHLKFIADGALIYFHEEHVVSGTTRSRIFPAGTTCTAGALPDGAKVSPGDTDWGESVWKDVRWSIGKPHYYQYCYTGTASQNGFAARADAALDGNGSIDSRFCVKGDPTPALFGPVEYDAAQSCEP